MKRWGWAFRHALAVFGVATAAAALQTAPALAANRLYWSNQGAPPGPGISFANLNGSGGGNLNTKGATTDSAVGVAIDNCHRQGLLGQR
jgi:hypothetical protein